MIHNIVSDLIDKAVPIEDLVPNAANTRRHNDKSIEAIMASLRQFGLRTPITVQKKGNVVRAGNGRLEAAKRLGWTHIAAVFVDDDDANAVAYEIVDNRSAQLSDWDEESLNAQLGTLKDFDDPTLTMMFAELSEEIGRQEAEAEEEEEASDAGQEDVEDEPATNFSIVIKCSDEDEQKELLEEFKNREIDCRALIS